MSEVLAHQSKPSHLDFWRDVARGRPGQQYDREQVLAGYTAALDNPACCVWRALMTAYPDAKVVLTLHPRGADAWYDSTIEAIYLTENTRQFKVLEWFTPFARKLGKMSRKLIWQRSHRGTLDDRAAAIAHHHQHIEEVTQLSPPAGGWSRSGSSVAPAQPMICNIFLLHGSEGTLQLHRFCRAATGTV